MLLELLFEAGAGAVVVGDSAPSLAGAVTVTGQSGSCPASVDPARLTVDWIVTNPDDANYETRVLQNGSLVSAQANSNMSYDREITDYVENGSVRPHFTSNWTYTVQIIRKADGVVIGSKTSAVWAMTYGQCTSAL